jgi:hypothetical protein
VRRTVLLDHPAEVLLALAPLAMPPGFAPPLPQVPFPQNGCQRVGADHQPFLRQLFTGQRGAKVVIPLLVPPDDLVPQFLRQPAVAHTPTQPMNQTASALADKTPPQPPGLPQRHPHEFRRFHHGKFPPFDPAQCVQPLTIPCRHKKCIHSGRYTRTTQVTLLLQLSGDNSIRAQHARRLPVDFNYG